jgi:hypothetical protein
MRELFGLLLIPVVAKYIGYVEAVGLPGGAAMDVGVAVVDRVAGPNAARVAALRAFGLDIRVLEGPADAASALKMSYAGITKGFTALASVMLLASVRGGTAKELHAELASSQKELLRWLEGSIPRMYDKAYRWVAEMEEISGFVSSQPSDAAVHAAFARFYERIAADQAGPKEETGALTAFLNQGKTN